MPAESLPVLALTVALSLDMLLGDPLWLPHPVRWMGRAIEGLEPVARRRIASPAAAGALMTLFLVAATWLAATMVVRTAAMLHPALALLVQTLMIYTCISARSLADAALAVGEALATSGLAAGRRAVAMIVGREVDRLDATGVTRAAVETVAENLVDGVIAPLCYVLLGGAPLAMAYKMVNTLDSMIGYRNDCYRDFGRFAARLDDAANYVPARISVPFIALAAHLLGGRGRRALTVARRDGRAHASPNAGFPEAAFAGALGLWMGGPNVYHGRRVAKPVIGRGLGDASAVHIRRACQLMLTTTLLFFLTAAGILLLMQLLV